MAIRLAGADGPPTSPPYQARRGSGLQAYRGLESPAPFASFYFSRTFILTGRPLGGVVSLAADDFAEVIVNGITVGTWGSTIDPSASGHYTLTSFDITSALRPGRNVITIHGQNANFSDCVVHCNYAANPAAVVFGGTLTA